MRDETERFRFRRQKEHDQEIRLYKQPPPPSCVQWRRTTNLQRFIPCCFRVFFSFSGSSPAAQLAIKLQGLPDADRSLTALAGIMWTPSQPSRQKATTPPPPPPGEGGVLNRNLGRGVRPTQRNLDPVQDTKDVNFATLSKRKCCNFLPCSRLDQAGYR